MDGRMTGWQGRTQQWSVLPYVAETSQDHVWDCRSSDASSRQEWKDGLELDRGLVSLTLLCRSNTLRVRVLRTDYPIRIITTYSVSEDSQKDHSQRTAPSNGGRLRFRSESRNNKWCPTGKLVGNFSGITGLRGTTLDLVRDMHPTTTVWYQLVKPESGKSKLKKFQIGLTKKNGLRINDNHWWNRQEGTQ